MGHKKFFPILLIDKVLKVGTVRGVAKVSSYILKLPKFLNENTLRPTYI